MNPRYRFISVGTLSGLAITLAGAFAAPARAQSAPNEVQEAKLDDTIVVTAERPGQQQNPATVATDTAEERAVTTTCTNAEDAVR